MPGSFPDAKTLFGQSVELPAAARPAFLDAACGGDACLRAEMEALLAAAAGAGDFLARGGLGAADDPATSAFVPAVADAPPPTIDYAGPQAGRVVGGKYRLLESIGEGGMGTVWMADQRDPVRRTVAVKLIKAGLDSRGTVARFEAERQALALMDHPNIAKILDAGTADDGRPFFVLELVKGVPITKYCDDHRLTPRERLALFVPICQAVQHAHQKGVIHRDIKPGNVLVAEYDGRPVPKVIDFGVAKAVGPQLTESTLHTGFGAVVGTPEYMSPEQASFNQLDVDTRTDVYALGVLLYELLAGAPPFRRKELQIAGLAEMLRVIREVEPPKPSTKISTADALPSIAANRKTEPRALSGLVRGELDWIVMRALEKDRRRRYDTAAGFARDVERYLAGEAVEAAPPSRAYRLRKFVRRNRTGLAVVGVVFVALAAGVVGTTAGLVRAERARADATTAATNARRLADSLRRVLETADLQAGGGGPFTVRKMLDEYAVNLEQDAAGQPDVDADLRLTIGRAYLNAGDVHLALPHLRRAVDLRRQHLGPRHPATAEALTALARASLTFNPAEKPQKADLLRAAEQAGVDIVEAIDILRAAPDAPKEGLVRALIALCWAREAEEKFGGRTKANEGYAREALALAEPPAGEPPTRLTADAAAEVAFALFGQGREAEEGVALERSLDLCRRAYPAVHPARALAAATLGYHSERAGRPAEAVRLLREAVDTYRSVYKGPQVDVVREANGLIRILHAQFRDAEAAAVAAEVSPEWAGKEYGVQSVADRNLQRAWAHLTRGDFAEADQFAAATIEYLEDHAGEGSDGMRLDAIQARSLALAWQDRRDDVQNLLADVRKPLREAADRGDDAVATIQNASLILQGPSDPPDLDRCEKLARRWLEKNGSAAKGDRGSVHAQIAWAMQSRGKAAAARGKAAAARGDVTAARREDQAARREDEAALGEWPKAMALLAPTGRSADPGLIRTSYIGWSEVLMRQRDFAKAEVVLREAVQRDDGLPADHPERAARRVLLADFLLVRGQAGKADAELQEAGRLLAANPQARSDSLTRRRLLVLELRGIAAALALWQRIAP